VRSTLLGEAGWRRAISQKPELLTMGRNYNGGWDSARTGGSLWGGRSVHVVSAMLPIWRQTFSSGVFLLSSSEALFYWKFFLHFSKSEQKHGGHAFPELLANVRQTP
jgi:hypothetical protein